MKKLLKNKYIYSIVLLLVLFALVKNTALAHPSLPGGAGQPGTPGGPEQPAANQVPNQPNLPGQPELPPCPENKCGESQPTTAPTVGPTSTQPTSPPQGGPNPTSPPGPPGPDNNKDDDGGTGGPAGQVLGLAATSSSPYNILIKGALGLSVVCFALVLKEQLNQTLRRKV